MRSCLQHFVCTNTESSSFNSNISNIILWLIWTVSLWGYMQTQKLLFILKICKTDLNITIFVKWWTITAFNQLPSVANHLDLYKIKRPTGLPLFDRDISITRFGIMCFSKRRCLWSSQRAMQQVRTVQVSSIGYGADFRCLRLQVRVLSVLMPLWNWVCLKFPLIRNPLLFVS